MGTKIPGVYVDFKGDLTKLKQDFRQAKSEAQKAGTDISNALGNAVMPNTVTSSFDRLYKGLTKINRASNLTDDDFKKVGVTLDSKLLKNINLTEKAFADLHRRILQKKATDQAERALRSIARQAGLTRSELTLLRFKMGDATGAVREFGRVGKSGFSKISRALTSLMPSITSFAAIFTSGALLSGAIEVGNAFDQTYFQMSYTFQDRTDAMIATAERMAQRFRYFYDVVDISYAFTKTADSMERYGITGQKYLDLVARAADVGAAKNLKLKGSIDRIESAMRGEAEASEYLGLTLNDTYMKNIAFGGSLKDTWEKLSDLEKAQYRFQELMQQSEKYTGAAEKATEKLSGASKRFWNTLKNELSPALKETNDGLAEFLNRITDIMDMPAERAIEKQIKLLEDSLKIAERSEKYGFARFWGDSDAKIQRITNAIEALREKLQLIGKDTDEYSNDWGDWNDGLKEAKENLAGLIKNLKEFHDAWGDESDIDYGFVDSQGNIIQREVAIAIQKIEEAENNRRVLLDRFYRLDSGTNRMSEEIEDTYSDYGNWMDGLVDDTEQTFDEMYHLSQRTANAMEDNFSDFFFDAFTGQLNDLGDYFDAFCNSILLAWADIMGQMAKEWIFGGDSGGGFGSFNWGKMLSSVVGLFGGGSSGPIHLGAGGTTAFGMAGGGVINEHVVGIGLRSGASYEFGEGNVPEIVMPMNRLGSDGGETIHVTNNFNISAIDERGVEQFLRTNQARIAEGTIQSLENRRSQRDALRSLM